MKTLHQEIMREARRSTKTKKSEFTQGYVCALANIVRCHGSNKYIEEGLRAAGIRSIADMKAAGVCAYDINVLRADIKNIQRKAGGV